MDWPAERKLARQRAQALGRMGEKQLGELRVEVWLAGYRGLLPDNRTEGTARHQAEMLAPFRAAFGELRMAEVTALQAQAYALANPAQVRYLRHAWEKAVLFRVVPLNIWRVVELPKRTAPKVRAPTKDELDGIVAMAAFERRVVGFCELVLVAAYSGARLSGLTGLTWANVDLAERTMTVLEKGGKLRTVVLGPPAERALRKARERRRGQGHVFYWHADGSPLTKKRVQEAWGRARGDFPFGFHSLKHFATGWLEGQGVASVDIAVQLGHLDSEGRPYVRLVERVYGGPADTAAALGRIRDRVS